MQLTPLSTLVYTRETDTVRTPSGAQIKQFQNTARAAVPEPTRFEPVGTSFEAAVHVANARALASQSGQAQAIVQGRDGAYYLTPLVDTHGQSLTFDGVTNTPHPDDRRDQRTPVERVVHTDWVLRLNPSVKAVVGTRSWSNFTDQRVEFGLELIQHASK